VIVAVTSLLLNTDLIPVLQNLNKKVFVLNWIEAGTTYYINMSIKRNTHRKLDSRNAQTKRHKAEDRLSSGCAHAIETVPHQVPRRRCEHLTR
jgi:hypothetical protein